MRGNRVTSGQFFKHQHTSCGGDGCGSTFKLFFCASKIRHKFARINDPLDPPTYFASRRQHHATLPIKKYSPPLCFPPLKTEREYMASWELLKCSHVGKRLFLNSITQSNGVPKKGRKSEIPNCFSHAADSRVIGCAECSFGFSLFLPTSLSRLVFLRITYT